MLVLGRRRLGYVRAPLGVQKRKEEERAKDEECDE
jgi:hypothetical protein